MGLYRMNILLTLVCLKIIKERNQNWESWNREFGISKRTITIEQLTAITGMINYSTIDETWTLFLDRDGVINGERKDEYVLRLEDFIFLDGTLQALKILNEVFGLIVIVTNQRGVGRGLMTLND